jgi:hypothetical protein
VLSTVDGGDLHDGGGLLRRLSGGRGRRGAAASGDGDNVGVEIVIKAIGNNEERKEITARGHKILTWKTLSNTER